MTSSERIRFQENYQKGYREGYQKGYREGMQRILLHQLQYKFGAVPEHYRQQLLQMDPEMLLAISVRLFEADSLAAFFQPLEEVAKLISSLSLVK